MISRRLYPHFSNTVKAFQFVYIQNPALIQDYNDISALSLDENMFFWCDGVSTPSVDSYFFDEKTLIAFISKSKLTGSWNTLIARADDEDTAESYLSISYWDTTVDSDEPFDTLKISYYSEYSVVPSAVVATVESDYISHVIDEGTSPDSSSMNWREHTNLNRTVSGVFFPKTRWVSSNSIDTHTSNSRVDSAITGYSNDVNISPKNVIVTSTLKNFHYNCIPSCTSSSCKLMVSPRFGVEFYDLTGTVYNQLGQISAPNFSSITANKACKIYRYGANIYLCYLPEEYKAYIGQLVLSGNSESWQIWQVAENSTAKVVVPSYFGIIPFVFIQYKGEWRISNALKLCSDISQMFASYNSVILNRKESASVSDLDSQQYPKDLPNVDTYTSIPVEVFFSSEKYIYPYMQNALYGMSTSSDNWKQRLCDYFFAQLYNSYQTLIQAFRVDEFYGENPQIEDCGIKVGKYFIPYSQDFRNSSEPQRVKTTVNAIEVGEGFEVDNFIAYYNNKLISLYSGVSVNVSSYSNVQMRHGILVGFKDNKYVQVQ